MLQDPEEGLALSALTALFNRLWKCPETWLSSLSFSSSSLPKLLPDFTLLVLSDAMSLVLSLSQHDCHVIEFCKGYGALY